MKKIAKTLFALFKVYNKWTGEERMSREMWKAAIVSTVSLIIIILGFFYDISEAQATALVTWVMAGVDMYLRISSKGGESVIKPEIRADLEKVKAVKKAEKSLMPELPGD